jgi:hypothetical protein
VDRHHGRRRRRRRRRRCCRRCRCRRRRRFELALPLREGWEGLPRPPFASNLRHGADATQKYLDGRLFEGSFVMGKREGIGWFS